MTGASQPPSAGPAGTPEQTRRRERAERTAAGVAYLTTAIGAALVVAPDRVGAALGVRDDLGLRVLGGVDLLIAAGIALDAAPARWMLARALANPPTALYLRRLGRRHGRRGPGLIGAAVLGASLADLVTAGELARL